MASLKSEENVCLAILYTQKVYQKMSSYKHFSFSLMADVMSCVRMMLCLGCCYCQFYDGRCYIICADVITHVYHLVDLIAFLNDVVSWYDTTFHAGLILADVIAKWQDGTTTFHY